LPDLSLYRRILGERFETLPEVLRRFHDTPGGGRARGSMRIERPPGTLRNGVASLLHFPAAGDFVPVRLEVAVVGNRERWTRWFGEQRLETVQWAQGELLMEAAGPVSFSSVLILEGSSLNYLFQRAWFWRVPIPRWLAPEVVGRAAAGEKGWHVDVRIKAPLLGELVHYQGWMEPQ
jgi:hypothetical protein